ncbi:MAG: hypothetical protein AAGG51_05290 [Cyanobacteria bacterium P01_G01_bin.54]
MNIEDTLTQKDLHRDFGWSRYLIRTICRNLDYTWLQGVKQYVVADLQASIKTHLNRPKTQQQTKNILTNALNHINGDTNVVKVDFLRKLSTKERTAFWRQRWEDACAEGQQVLAEVDALLEKVEQMGLG